MRSGHKKNKEHNRSLITILVIIAVILVLFIATYFGIIYYREYKTKKEIASRTLRYNNMTFIKENNEWITKFKVGPQPYIMSFYYSPLDAENVSMEYAGGTTPVNRIKTFRQFHPDGKVYITVNPNDSSSVVIAAVEVSKILGTGYNLYNLNVSSAVTTQINDSAYPVITCKDQNSSSTLVIWIVVNKENKLSALGNCIVVEAKSTNETILVADALSYRLLNIIQKPADIVIK